MMGCRQKKSLKIWRSVGIEFREKNKQQSRQGFTTGIRERLTERELARTVVIDPYRSLVSSVLFLSCVVDLFSVGSWRPVL